MAAMLGGAANAQSSDAAGAKKTAEEQEAQASFRADSNLVVIPVSVTDKLNRFVLGLRQTEFKILDDGVEQKIAHFSGEDVPLSIGLVFDTSGSMDYKMSAARDAAVHFLKTLTAGDEAFLAEFNDKVNLAAPFTSHMQEIQSAFQNVQPGGLTALLDAVKFSLAEMKKAKNSRKAIVMISDGGDNHSSYTPAQIEALVREADVEIYAMGVFDPLASIALTKEEVSGPRLLSEIATQTGGRAYAASVSSDLPSVASRIAIELRNQYVLGYYPADQKRDGKYHKVEITVNQPASFPTLKLHWRQGYYAPSAAQ
ncbi:MAG TPA: VWA domain-containing protein [Bryobacteraceae bacterium]|nr:VWA domain-containing protein [Bryobacteraceae bacterium]